jgi:RNA polymerase sigma-70 factor (ECF subfamily)
MTDHPGRDGQERGATPRRPRPPRELLEGVRRRDREALGRFFDLYADLIHGLALRLLRDPQAAQDVVQNVFVKVHRAADRLDPERDPGPWLATITSNECRGRWRSWAWKLGRRSRPLDGEDDLVERLAAASPDPEEEVLAAEERRTLERAVGRLPEDQRTVVLLHDHQGFTHEEIAPMVGASPAAVRKRYSRALARLRELLEDESR